MQHRQEIVKKYRSNAVSQRKIAEEFGIVPSTVHYWLKKDGQISHNRRGRPRKTDDDLDKDLYLMSLENPFRSAVELRRQLAPHVSVDTVRRRLKLWGMQCRTPARKPHLSPEHMQKRYQFASDHLNWTVDRWHKVVFSDEKIFRTFSRGPLHVWRPEKSDRYDSKFLVSSTNEEGNRFTISVWMAFGGDGAVRQLHRIARYPLDSKYYTETILPLVEEDLVNHRLVYMQDRSSIHMAGRTTDWLASHNVEWMEDWPAKGPDMNPVENVWAELVRRTRPSAANEGELWENILQSFERLDDDYFRKLVESMPTRMLQVYEKRGNWTKY